MLSLRLAGIKSIEKPVEIPFYKKTIKNDFCPDRYRVKGIYGENGSGKTAVMMAVRIMTRVLLDRNYLSDQLNQRLLTECINKQTRRCFIDVTFFSFYGIGPFIYHYRMDLEIRKDGRVYLAKEMLERKIGHNTQAPYMVVFETRDGELISFNKGEMFEYCVEKTKNLLEFRSFATFSNELEFAGYQFQKLPEKHLLTLSVFASKIHVEIDEEDTHNQEQGMTWGQLTQKSVVHEPEDLTIFSRVSVGRRNDTEVILPKSQLQRYKEEIKKLFRFIRIFKTDLQDIDVDAKEYGEFYICRRIMVYKGFRLDEEYESRGIRKLMRLYDTLDAACTGYIVFIDELDSSINDIYLDKLIEYFTIYGKGQLCFTAHNLSPMSVLRDSKCAISFISGVNTVHTWTSRGNQNPEHAYRNGFIDNSPFNVDASDFLGVLGGNDE